MKTVYDCPLGNRCKYVDKEEDDVIHRCAWLVEISGKNPNTGEDVNEEKCAMAWFPILQLETSQTNRSTSAAVESLRNETVKRQDAAIHAIREAEKNAFIEHKQSG